MPKKRVLKRVRRIKPKRIMPKRRRRGGTRLSQEVVKLNKKEALSNYRKFLTTLFHCSFNTIKQYHNYIKIYRRECLNSGILQSELNATFADVKKEFTMKWN